nr:MAG TPA: hypothetical protein [Caudoviricetes sp.]
MTPPIWYNHINFLGDFISGIISSFSTITASKQLSLIYVSTRDALLAVKVKRLFSTFLG